MAAMSLQGPHRFRIGGINPQLGIVSELRHLAGEDEVQVIDVDDRKEGPQYWPLGNTTVNSSPVRWHTIDEDSLPPSCQQVFNLGSNIALEGQEAHFSHQPFVKDLFKGSAYV